MRTSFDHLLQRLVARIVPITLASAAFGGVAVAALATACGGSTDGVVPGSGSSSSSSGSSGSTGEPRSLCTDRPASLPEGLTSSPALDYVAMRSEVMRRDSDGGSATTVDFAMGAETGSACATATDAAACRTKLADLRVLPADPEACSKAHPPRGMAPSPQNPFVVCEAYYYAYTRGDEVGTAVTDDEVLALMGTIDTLQEAQFVLAKAGYSPACGGTDGVDYTVVENGDGFELRFANNCDEKSEIHTVVVKKDGTVTETKTEPVPAGKSISCAVAGRRPAGFEQRPVAAPPSTPMDARARGAYFASMAELEAGAVIAFRALHGELARLGAPRALLDRVREAIRDEVRHTRATRALAKREGVTANTPSSSAPSARSAFEIAVENAREGCVRETYGALLTAHQAAHAEDRVVRAAMRAIADEETAHAALSWEIAAWLDGLLTDEERIAVDGVRREALAELDRELDAPLDRDLARSAGLPAPAVARWMLREAAGELGIAA